MDFLGSMPILVRELTIATRISRMRWPRVGFVWGLIRHAQVKTMVRYAFRLMVGLHILSCFGVIGISARNKLRRVAIDEPSLRWRPMHVA